MTRRGSHTSRTSSRFAPVTTGERSSVSTADATVIMIAKGERGFRASGAESPWVTGFNAPPFLGSPVRVVRSDRFQTVVLRNVTQGVGIAHTMGVGRTPNGSRRVRGAF